MKSKAKSKTLKKAKFLADFKQSIIDAKKGKTKPLKQLLNNN